MFQIRYLMGSTPLDSLFFGGVKDLSHGVKKFSFRRGFVVYNISLKYLSVIVINKTDFFERDGNESENVPNCADPWYGCGYGRSDFESNR